MKYENIIYNRLKYGLLKEDKQLKEKIEKYITQINTYPLFDRILIFYQYIKEQEIIKLKDEELFLFSLCCLIIYYELKIVPLNFDEIFVATQFFMKEKIRFKKDKKLLAFELIKLYKNELLNSIPEKFKNIVKLLSEFQGEIDEKEFIKLLNLDKRSYFLLLDELEKYKIAKWTTGFKIKLDIYGKIIEKLLKEN